MTTATLERRHEYDLSWYLAPDPCADPATVDVDWVKVQRVIDQVLAIDGAARDVLVRCSVKETRAALAGDRARLRTLKAGLTPDERRAVVRQLHWLHRFPPGYIALRFGMNQVDVQTCLSDDPEEQEQLRVRRRPQPRTVEATP